MKQAALLLALLVLGACNTVVGAGRDVYDGTRHVVRRVTE